VRHLSMMTAPSFEWITVLSILDTPNDRQDWTRLARLSNLGALHVQNWKVSTGAIDDVVIKEWARAAREEGAFSALKVIMMRNQGRITMGIFDDFVYFPSLRILHLACPILGARQAKIRTRDTRWIWMSELVSCGCAFLHILTNF
jgi:hypothetical protein